MAFLWWPNVTCTHTQTYDRPKPWIVAIKRVEIIFRCRNAQNTSNHHVHSAIFFYLFLYFCAHVILGRMDGRTDGRTNGKRMPCATICSFAIYLFLFVVVVLFLSSLFCCVHSQFTLQLDMLQYDINYIPCKSGLTLNVRPWLYDFFYVRHTLSNNKYCVRPSTHDTHTHIYIPFASATF